MKAAGEGISPASSRADGLFQRNLRKEHAALRENSRGELIQANLKRVRVEVAGEEVAQQGSSGWSGTGAEVGRADFPDPDQVVQAVVIDETVKKLAIEFCGAANTFASGPPENLRRWIRAGDSRGQQLPLCPIRVGFRLRCRLAAQPALVERSAGGKEVAPFVVMVNRFLA